MKKPSKKTAAETEAEIEDKKDTKEDKKEAKPKGKTGRGLKKRPAAAVPASSEPAADDDEAPGPVAESEATHKIGSNAEYSYKDTTGDWEAGSF